MSASALLSEFWMSLWHRRWCWSCGAALPGLLDDLGRLRSNWLNLYKNSASRQECCGIFLTGQEKRRPNEGAPEVRNLSRQWRSR